MNGLFLFLSKFLGATIEGVEMAAILVGVGMACGWRSTILGALAGFALLAALTIILGNALLRIPIQGLRVVVGSLLLILPSMAQESSAANCTTAYEEPSIG